MKITRYAVSVILLLLSAGTAAGNKCDPLWDKTAPPQHIIAMNQHAADMVLALDAGPQMLGVSYIDDSAEALKSGRYHGIPVFSAKYPATEKLIASGADFVVAGFSSAFMASMGGQDDL
ncbi:ABC transporter, partial [Morganella morganii]|nr:ABC transporter [Morganella morganii]